MPFIYSFILEVPIQHGEISTSTRESVVVVCEVSTVPSAEVVASATSLHIQPSLLPTTSPSEAIQSHGWLDWREELEGAQNRPRR